MLGSHNWTHKLLEVYNILTVTPKELKLIVQEKYNDNNNNRETTKGKKDKRPHKKMSVYKQKLATITISFIFCNKDKIMSQSF